MVAPVAGELAEGTWPTVMRAAPCPPPSKASTSPGTARGRAAGARAAALGLHVDPRDRLGHVGGELRLRARRSGSVGRCSRRCQDPAGRRCGPRSPRPPLAKRYDLHLGVEVGGRQLDLFHLRSVEAHRADRQYRLRARAMGFLNEAWGRRRGSRARIVLRRFLFRRSRGRFLLQHSPIGLLSGLPATRYDRAFALVAEAHLGLAFGKAPGTAAARPWRSRPRHSGAST